MKRAFAELEHGVKKCRARREAFPGEMNGLVPWVGRGCGAHSPGVMLRVYCMQSFHDLGASGMES